MKKEKIKTVDGQTLLDMQLPQIRFVVESLLPQGLHILAGAAKTGKSWLLLLLSLRVAQANSSGIYKQKKERYCLCA